MKVLYIASKDMLRYFRSAFAVGMMLVVPLLITGLLYAAFGNVLSTSESDVYTLPQIKVQMVNLDKGDANGENNAGQILVDALRSEDVQDVFAVTLATGIDSARQAVDQQEAALAIIIPANFTQAAASGQGKAVVEFYEDPTLSFGPGIAREIVGQFLDALTGAQIAGSVLDEQFGARSLVVDRDLAQQVQASYMQWFTTLPAERGWNLPLVTRLPNRTEAKTVTDHRNSLMGPVMAGMLIFFVFFTGANTAQSVIKEQEEGTLARIFTTPTPVSVILGGKFSAVFLTLIVQAIVLTLASGWIFGIDWGNRIALGIVLAALVMAGAGFGILLMAFMKTSRQAGAVTGGVLAVMGMMGGLFSTGFSGVPAALETASLFVPQGWALRGMRLVLFGAVPQDVLLPAAVLLGFGIVFFVIGARLFRQRFV